MKKNLFSKIKELFQKEQPTKAERNELPTASPFKKKGRGAYFHNNRKRTRGRTLQYIQLADGRTKVIRHETV